MTQKLFRRRIVEASYYDYKRFKKRDYAPMLPVSKEP